MAAAAPQGAAGSGGDSLDGDRFARGFTVGAFHTKMVALLQRLKRIAETPPHVAAECVTGHCFHNADPATLSVDELHAASMEEVVIIEGFKKEMQTAASLRQVRHTCNLTRGWLSSQSFGLAGCARRWTLRCLSGVRLSLLSSTTACFGFSLCVPL